EDRLPPGFVETSDGDVAIVAGGAPLPTLRVLPQGISRKRLEQAVRDLGLPVVLAHDVDEADVVMTLKNEYKQKTPLLRDAEDRSMPIYVLKSNTIPQMQSSLTSVFALEVDPREAALRETEDAIDLVLSRSEPVELSPQNAFIRRLQHQMAERANLVSRSRGREPYRRVRLYPDPARSAWRYPPSPRPVRRRLARGPHRMLGRVTSPAASAATIPGQPDLPPTPEEGLDDAEVARRRAAGLGNEPPPPTTRTYAQILRENVFTFVNNILFALGIALVLVGRPFDALVSLTVISTNV